MIFPVFPGQLWLFIKKWGDDPASPEPLSSFTEMPPFDRRLS